MGVIDATDFQTSETANGGITLPIQFDYYLDDAYQTPFLNGTDVTFYIRARNDAGLGPLSSALIVSDGTPPTINLVQTGGTAASQGDAHTVTVRLTSALGEYLADSVTITTQDGGSEDYTLPTSRISFAWDTPTYNNTPHYDKTAGTITISVPADTDYTGDTIVVTCTDTSGNSYTATLDLI